MLKDQMVPVKGTDNMSIKSNMELINQLNKADKQINKISKTTGRTYGINNPDPKTRVDVYDPKYDEHMPIAAPQVRTLNVYISRTLDIIQPILSQFRSIKEQHYLEFPHQNTFLKNVFGNHHVTSIKDIKIAGDKLVLQIPGIPKKNHKMIPVAELQNMHIKSNADLIERLNAAYKYLVKASKITSRKNKDGESQPMNVSEVDSVDFAVTRAMMAIYGELTQFRARDSAHYLEFPHQNRLMRKRFGNHSVTIVSGIAQKDNKLILRLGKKRRAVTGFIDVLNYTDVRKGNDGELWSADKMPDGLQYAADDKRHKRIRK